MVGSWQVDVAEGFPGGTGTLGLTTCAISDRSLLRRDTGKDSSACGIADAFFCCWRLARHTASLDCSKAKTSLEKAVCSSLELSAADEQIAAAYKALVAATTLEVRPAMRDNQRSWNRKTAADCKSPAPDAGRDAGNLSSSVVLVFKLNCREQD